MIKKATSVPPEGNKLSCSLALVGEQPGRYEVYARKPFVGPSGKELNSCLSSAGISRYECYLTNVVKDLDHPISEYVKFNSKGEGIYSADGLEYLEILKKELSDCNANVIVVIGNVALYALTMRYGITKWRGSLLESTLLPGRKVIPIIHPATILQPKNVYLNRRLIINDLIKADEESKTKEFSGTKRNIKISPSFHESLAFLNLCYDLGKKGTMIDFDIEVYNNYVSCISFAHSPIDAISIPFLDSHGDYFTVEQESEIWRAIALILEDPTIIKRGQNLGFDATVMLSQFGIKTYNIADTMVAQKILSPDYPAGLDFIASVHTDIPYYKADGKRWFKVGGLWETLWHYNAMDSITCADAYPSQLKDLEKQGNYDTFVEQCRIIEPLVYMMKRGIRVDTVGMVNAKVGLDARVVERQAKLDLLAGQPINPNSPAQMIWYFYDHLGHKPYYKKGKITTDETALTRLYRKGVEEAGLVKDIRSLRKLSSTYTNLDKVDDDGRIRCSYNPVGTVNGRISSSENIFGTGMNLQNWPHEMLRYLLADLGYVFYSLDLSQVENRIVAYVGHVPRMMKAFEDGKDVHTLTASLIFDKSMDEISNEDGSSPLGTGKQSERFWGKKTNHELNYDMGYKSFSLLMEMDEKQGKWIVEKYFKAYPEIRGYYHPMIRMQLGKDRTLTNLFNRKRVFLGKWEDMMFKKAYNFIPQSTTADIINRHGLSYIYYNQDKFGSLELLNQVHDSIGFQLPLSIPWIKHAEILLDIKRSMEVPLTTGPYTFTVPVDIQMGLTLSKANGVEFKHAKMPSTVQEFAKELEGAYDGFDKERGIK